MRAWRIEQRLTQTEAANRAGMTRSYWANLETEQQEIPLKLLPKLISLLQVKEVVPTVMGVEAMPMARIKVVGKVGAGPAESNVDPDERSVNVPMTLAQIGGLGWVVEGESMMPALEPGDVAVFREHRSPRRGFPMLVEKSPGEVRVKIIEWKDNQWTQCSVNRTFADEPLGNWQILGYMVGFYRSRGSRGRLEYDSSGFKFEREMFDMAAPTQAG